MFHMSLEKIWLGPTRYIWDKECPTLGDKTKNNVDGCKDRCEKTESCNAIQFYLTICILKACESPVPAPPYLPSNQQWEGHYLATGKNEIDT